MESTIYLDYNATTPVAAEVVEIVTRALREGWGNPSSPHGHGRRSRAMVDRAREQVAALLRCRPTEIVFTSGGTESDNAAIIGVAEAREKQGRHLVTSTVEHPAVEQACRYLEGKGWTVSRVPVDRDGRVEAERLARELREETTLVTVMHAHNETGVIQPVREIAELAHDRGVAVHTDAAQSVGKIDVGLDTLGVDLLALAGHKLYGPPGVGALILRDGTPFSGFMRGAGHESGRRPGTENVAGIAGLGAACELARNELDRRCEHMRTMRERLERGLRGAFPDLVVHGERVERLPNTLFAALPGIDANRLMQALPQVAMSAGSACHSDSSLPSGTLHAMGVSDTLARCTLRLSVGRDSTIEQIDRAVQHIVAAGRDLGS